MKKNNNGFTLIELLAVIIILGILMLVAIPSVTRYISDSRKSAYVDTAKQIVNGARNEVNSGKLNMYDPNTTYYIPTSYIKTEGSSKSPYGEFTQAYIGVTYNQEGYNYYWISVDTAGQGVKDFKLSDDLDTDDIVAGIKSSDIENKIKTTGIGNRNTILVLENGTWSSPYQAEHHVSENGDAYNGLTYEGVPVVFSSSELKTKLEARCSGHDLDQSLGITFGRVSVNYAHITLNNYFTSRADIGLKTSVSIETDAETGDSRVVTGSCTKQLSNLDVSKFLYNGDTVTVAKLEQIANDQCSALREVFESLDVECVKSLINSR